MDKELISEIADMNNHEIYSQSHNVTEAIDMCRMLAQQLLELANEVENLTTRIARH